MFFSVQLILLFLLCLLCLIYLFCIFVCYTETSADWNLGIVTAEHTGSYTCTASNTLKTVSQQLELNVQCEYTTIKGCPLIKESYLPLTWQIWLFNQRRIRRNEWQITSTRCWSKDSFLDLSCCFAGTLSTKGPSTNGCLLAMFLLK